MFESDNGLITLAILTFCCYLLYKIADYFYEKKRARDAKIFELAQWEQRLQAQHAEILKKEAELQELINEKSIQYPWLAKVFSDYLYMYDTKTAQYLRTKSRPAYKAAEQVALIAKEKRDLQKLCKLQEYQLFFYENAFPWLEDVKEADIYAIWEYFKESESGENEYDSVSKWLSPEEYNRLSTKEKYQLALNRYNKRNKSDWEIGIEYERYIGFLYEKQGEKVTYYGALNGKEDIGRDLIVEKKNEILVIQCKRWAQRKTIHEKHIFQLFGSVVSYSLDNNPKLPVKGVFVTTTSLSPKAKQYANYLNIDCVENFPFKDYPLIKCNISRKSGEKIYHLPFDQQYDKVVIEYNKGEFYAMTIEEAEKAGFRRAWKHTAK